MKKILLPALSLVLSVTASHGAIALLNGNFEDTSGTFPAGWSVTGTAGNVTSVTSGANLIGGGSTASLVGNGGINQDFAVTDADGLTFFQLNMAFRLDNVAAAGAGSERIRIRDNANSGDLITLRLNAAGIDRYSTAVGGSFASALSYAVASDTTYYLRLTVNGIGSTNGGSYTIGLSTDGVNYTTSSAITAFHSPAAGSNFETLTLENGGGGGFFVDGITIVPEPSAALLGAIGVLGLLRRRR